MPLDYNPFASRKMPTFKVPPLPMPPPIRPLTRESIQLATPDAETPCINRKKLDDLPTASLMAYANHCGVPVNVEEVVRKEIVATLCNKNEWIPTVPEREGTSRLTMPDIPLLSSSSFRVPSSNKTFRPLRLGDPKEETANRPPNSPTLNPSAQATQPVESCPLNDNDFKLPRGPLPTRDWFRPKIGAFFGYAEELERSCSRAKATSQAASVRAMEFSAKWQAVDKDHARRMRVIERVIGSRMSRRLIKDVEFGLENGSLPKIPAPNEVDPDLERVEEEEDVHDAGRPSRGSSRKKSKGKGRATEPESSSSAPPSPPITGLTAEEAIAYDRKVRSGAVPVPNGLRRSTRKRHSNSKPKAGPSKKPSTSRPPVGPSSRLKRKRISEEEDLLPEAPSPPPEAPADPIVRNAIRRTETTVINLGGNRSVPPTPDKFMSLPTSSCEELQLFDLQPEVQVQPLRKRARLLPEGTQSERGNIEPEADGSPAMPSEDYEELVSEGVRMAEENDSLDSEATGSAAPIHRDHHDESDNGPHIDYTLNNHLQIALRPPRYSFQNNRSVYFPWTANLRGCPTPTPNVPPPFVSSPAVRRDAPRPLRRDPYRYIFQQSGDIDACEQPSLCVRSGDR